MKISKPVWLILENLVLYVLPVVLIVGATMLYQWLT